MSDQLIHKFSAQSCKPKVPKLKAGYQVRVHQKITEGNKERVQIFEGMIIRQNSGYGINDTFTVRKVSEGVGVEKTFLIHSPNIVKIDVVRAHKIRRSKLHFLRTRSGKALRLKEVPLDLKYKEFEVQTTASEISASEEKSALEAGTETQEQTTETENIDKAEVEAEVEAETETKAESKTETEKAKTPKSKAPEENPEPVPPTENKKQQEEEDKKAAE